MDSDATIGLNQYVRGLDQGGYGKAKCYGNGSQSMDSDATIGLNQYAGGLDQGRYGKAKC